ncbi:MAG: ABC transporter ATP-binding protein [Firmicutes bacterium]|nr:ABC transporter ATP-binding protein [Bacillota bacterium]
MLAHDVPPRVGSPWPFSGLVRVWPYLGLPVLQKVGRDTVASLRIDRVFKRFGSVTALAQVTLDIHDGELMVLLGPSGCGKTTLLRAVAGLETVDGGEIYVGTERVTEIPPHRRNIAMVFQNYALYPNLNVFDNIAFPLRARRMPREKVAQQVQAAAHRLGLTEILGRKPHQLSGGQRQRVAIARAIVREPAVFLMDEPLSNLDAQLRGRLRTELTRLQRQLRTTTIYVTHDQVEAMTMGDRIAILEGGRLQQVGTPAELYHRPVNLFVAGFLGSPSMNLVEAQSAPRKGKPGVLLGGQGWLPLPDHYRHLPPGLGVKVGIRPESLQIRQAADAFATGRVEVVEYSGFETVLVVSVQGPHTIQEWSVKMLGHPPARVGDVVPLTVSPDQIHLFLSDSGERIGMPVAPGEPSHLRWTEPEGTLAWAESLPAAAPVPAETTQ